MLPLPPLHRARGDGTRVPLGQSRPGLLSVRLMRPRFLCIVCSCKCGEAVINLQNLSAETHFILYLFFAYTLHHNQLEKLEAAKAA